MSGPLKLPPRLDLPMAAPLAQQLADRRGADLHIDAGAVTHLGGLCLQVLLSAAKTWRSDRLRMTFSASSAAFDAALALYGTPHRDLLSERAA